MAAATPTATLPNISGTSGVSCAASGEGARDRRPRVVGHEALRRAIDDRAAFFEAMAQSASVGDVHRASASVVVARNFRLVKPIAHGGNGIVYEAKCIGEGHPALFRDQSYVLKVPFNYGVSTTRVQNEFENEYLISSTLDPHPNINHYFCHFTDRIPQEYYDHLPAVAKGLAYDAVHMRMHACIWVVLEHHSETLEQFLKDLRTTPNPLPTTTTPWPIVHKYSRDICAALVHLFVNQTIHFDMKLNNIVISSNKEQAILIDLGCAMKFPATSNKSFERETVCLVGALGNQSHRAPEFLNGIALFTQNPNHGSMLRCDKQPSFELGCILFELAMCGEHPLPGYPGGYGPSGHITFSFDSEEQFPMQPPAFPKAFCNLVRALLQLDPEKRMPLLEAAHLLENLESPYPYQLASLYSYILPVRNDAESLTMKAACEILSGAPAAACEYTLQQALEVEFLFSPALLLLHYINCCSAVNNHPTSSFSSTCQQGIRTALTGKQASFSTTDVDFVRAIVSNRHRTTLPELVLKALWMRHISHDDENFREITQLLLKTMPTAETQRQRLLATPLSSPTSLFLRLVVYSRNEMMVEALGQLEMGNIDCALGLVSEAATSFECEMNLQNKDWENYHDEPKQCLYLPGLLSVPAYSIKPIGDFLAILLNTGSEGPLHTCVEQDAENGYSGKYINKAVNLYQRAADAGNAMAMCNLGVCYQYGNGVDKDMNKAVTLYQRAAAAGNTMAMCKLGVCYYNGNGVDKDMNKAVTLYQRAADAGNAMAMCNLGACYQYGNGVDKDMNKAVTFYQRAADAGYTMAMCNLGVCYQYGNGVDKDINQAVTLYRRAAYAGNTMAMCKLGACYKYGNGVDTDMNQAVTLYQRAADAGNAMAMCKLGVCYQNGEGVYKDMNKAVTLYQRAAAAGNTMAMCKLGVCYQYGNGVYKDMNKAVTLYQRAAEAGDTIAMCKLGVCYQYGNGVDKDMNKAVTLFQRAEARGGATLTGDYID
ncbi:sel1 repeat family protein [Pelomyxa schiedti]|nr:sel1 repeat family protein [Pelomyxa schiedti]